MGEKEIKARHSEFKAAEKHVILNSRTLVLAFVSESAKIKMLNQSEYKKYSSSA